jgi:hypothetical protein
MFSHDIINFAQEHIDIDPWFSYLDCTEITNFMSEFEWLKDEKLLFIWVTSNVYMSFTICYCMHILAEYYIFTRNC